MASRDGSGRLLAFLIGATAVVLAAAGYSVMAGREPAVTRVALALDLQSAPSTPEPEPLPAPLPRPAG